MVLQKCSIPYGGYWSTPFCRWQGSLANLNSLKLAGQVAKKFLSEKDIDPERLDALFLGFTVPQKQCFYGAPWLAGMIGAPAITGPSIAQACATSVRTMLSAALQVELGMSRNALLVTCDRTSNGPHIYYPNPKGIGGGGETEDPVWDNFNFDPYAKIAMIQTGENVAKKESITKDEQHELTLVRYRQYESSLKDERAFQKRYMVGVELPRGRKSPVVISGDEGVHPTTRDGLEKLRPVLEGGTVTFGSQTHPADGNAGMLICDQETAAELSSGPKISVRSFGEARVEKSFMPMAVVPAARRALDAAGIKVSDCRAVKTHNPFAINDIFFCRELGLDISAVNNYGSPLIYGHPQGPTGTRAVIELIEELVLAGGGYGLFSGCAAGDSAMALVLEVS